MKRLKNEQEKFNDFLRLDCETIAEFFTLLELKIFLETEPYNRETLSLINNLIGDYEGREMYEWCAVLHEEYTKRVTDNVI